MVLSLRSGRWRRIALALLCVVSLTSGCATLFRAGPGEALSSAPAVVLDADDVATFDDGSAWIASVDVWRDREPVAGDPPPCADLCSRVRLLSSGFDVAALQVTELWVVRGSTAARFPEALAEPDLPPLTVTGRRGPRLRLSGEVRVVARIQRSDGTARWVRSGAAPVEVER